MFFKKAEEIAYQATSIFNTHPALLKYFKDYPETDAPFMHRQLVEWYNKRPFSGIRVLHHVPVVPNTLLKIACLIEAGAEVTVTNPSFLSANPLAVASLRAAGVRYVENVHDLEGEQFDLYFDCGAELYQALGAPLLGAVELTASGDQIYRNQSLSFPVISIDHSLTKQLETIFGCAESCHTAIAQLSGINPAAKTWIVFGFGKIGRGVAYFCLQHGARISVVDICEQQRQAAKELGLEAIDPQDSSALQSAIASADIVVTATGHAASMAPYPHAWFKDKILANMGVYDEYGAQFSTEEVLNNKLPINFVLNDPTPMRFIDPVFYIHNIAGLVLIQKLLSNGIHGLPMEIDHPIIQQWCQYHSFTPEIITQWFINPQDSSSEQLVQSYAETHYPDLRLLPQMHAQMLWLQENSVTSSRSNVEAKIAPVNIEVRRSLSRLSCLNLLVIGGEASYQLFIQSQPEDKILSPAKFNEFSYCIQQLSPAELDCLKASCFITKSDRAIMIMALAEQRNRPIPSDSEQFITYMVTHFPHILPISSLFSAEAIGLLTSAFCKNSHLRHMLHLEGGYNMVADLTELSRTRRLSYQQYHLWYARWIINIAGLDGHVNHQGSRYLTESVADNVLALKTELDQLWINPQYPVVDRYLASRARKLNLSSPYIAYLAVHMNEDNPENIREIQAWFAKLSPVQRQNKLQIFQSQLTKTKITPTFKPTVLATLRAVGCSISDTLTLFTEIETVAMQTYFSAVEEQHLSATTPLSFRDIAFKKELVPIKAYYDAHNKVPELHLDSSGYLTVTQHALQNEPSFSESTYFSLK